MSTHVTPRCVFQCFYKYVYLCIYVCICVSVFYIHTVAVCVFCVHVCVCVYVMGTLNSACKMTIH